jgi:hypothetical protein
MLPFIPLDPRAIPTFSPSVSVQDRNSFRKEYTEVYASN